MKQFFTVILIIFAINAFGQKNQISLSAFEQANIWEAFNVKYENKIANSIFFERKIGANLALIGGATFSNLTIDDYCDNCADVFQGVGDYKEKTFLFGVKSYLPSLPIKRLKPFMEYDIFYSQTTYSGEFGGGFIGQGLIFEHNYQKVGIIGRAGLDIQITKNIVITPLTSLRFAYIEADLSQPSTGQSMSEISSWIPIDLRLGYRF